MDKGDSMTMAPHKFKCPFSMFAPLIWQYMENLAGTGHIWKTGAPIFHVCPFNMVIGGKSFHSIGVICGK